jgi:alanine-glyoxylate transaminase/(R)-3-amino-2-methylpropionate-pyruvate transaminase
VTPKKPMTSAEVRAKHKEFLFPSCANYYEEPVVLDRGKGSRLEGPRRRELPRLLRRHLDREPRPGARRVNRALHAQIDRLGHTSRRSIRRFPSSSSPRSSSLSRRARSRRRSSRRAAPKRTRPPWRSRRSTRGGRRSSRSGTATRGARCSRMSLTAHSSYRVVPRRSRPSSTPTRPTATAARSASRTRAATSRARRTSRSSSRRRPPVTSPASWPSRSGRRRIHHAPDGYFKVAVEIIKKYGGVFICDEVQTGFGRTGGKMWGIEHHDGVEPDIMTMAKGIANGLPLGATLATTAIADSWKGGNISTFGGNPLSATAANATIDTIVEEKLADNAAAMGKVLYATGSRRCRRSTPARSATSAARGSCKPSSS